MKHLTTRYDGELKREIICHDRVTVMVSDLTDHHSSRLLLLLLRCVPITEDDERPGGEGEGAEQTEDQGGRPPEQQPPRLRQDRGEQRCPRHMIT